MEVDNAHQVKQIRSFERQKKKKKNLAVSLKLYCAHQLSNYQNSCFASVHWSHWRPLILNTANILLEAVWNLGWTNWYSRHWFWLFMLGFTNHSVGTTQSRPHSPSFTWARVAFYEVLGLQDIKPNLKSIGGHKGHSDNILENVAPAMELRSWKRLWINFLLIYLWVSLYNKLESYGGELGQQKQPFVRLL